MFTISCQIKFGHKVSDDKYWIIYQVSNALTSFKGNPWPLLSLSLDLKLTHRTLRTTIVVWMFKIKATTRRILQHTSEVLAVKFFCIWHNHQVFQLTELYWGGDKERNSYCIKVWASTLLISQHQKTCCLDYRQSKVPVAKLF